MPRKKEATYIPIRHLYQDSELDLCDQEGAIAEEDEERTLESRRRALTSELRRDAAVRRDAAAQLQVTKRSTRVRVGWF